MAEENPKEAIVFAWAKIRTQNIGGRALGSEYDNYDTECGWNAADFAQARGGTNVSFYTVGISMIGSQGTRDIGLRLDDVPDNKKGEKPIVLYGRGDVAILHKSGERLLDIGKYGIFNTLTGRELHASPNERDKITNYDGSEVCFIEGYPPEFGQGIYYFDSDRFDSSPFKINLEEGLERGRFTSQKVTKEGEVGEDVRSFACNRFTFEVNGRQYSVNNELFAGTHTIETSRMLDPDNKTILEFGLGSKTILAAVGFPEHLLGKVSNH